MRTNETGRGIRLEGQTPATKVRCMPGGNDTSEEVTATEKELLRAHIRGIFSESINNLLEEDTSSPAALASSSGVDIPFRDWNVMISDCNTATRCRSVSSRVIPATSRGVARSTSTRIALDTLHHVTASTTRNPNLEDTFNSPPINGVSGSKPSITGVLSTYANRGSFQVAGEETW